MANESSVRFARRMAIVFLCVLAAWANFGLSIFVIKVPLYLDTLFTAAVCFTAGLWPGLLTALLTHAVKSMMEGSITSQVFIFCSIAEVLLVWRLNPTRGRGPGSLRLAGVFAGLLLLYIAACIVISILGGLVDFVFHGLLANPKNYFSPEDTFKISLFKSGISTLSMGIISRVPVNIVDRFIVIFGGFIISRGLLVLMKRAFNR